MVVTYGVILTTLGCMGLLWFVAINATLKHLGSKEGIPAYVMVVPAIFITGIVMLYYGI